jgi:erythromycin esterase-like protein
MRQMPALLSLLLLFLAWPTAAQPSASRGALVTALEQLSIPLHDSGDLDPLVRAIGDAPWVLLGESSHGTHEFYTWRDLLSRRLVAERGFDLIAIEASWSDLLPLDRYVRHAAGAPDSARAALERVRTWPRWVLANEEMVRLGEWLREFNRDRPPQLRVGIHGIDVHGIWDSIRALRQFARRFGPDFAHWVDANYAPLLDFDQDSFGYARHVHAGGRSARTGAHRVAMLLQRWYGTAPAALRPSLFEMARHADVVQAGERYLATMGGPGPDSWNVRPVHFARTLDRLLAHYGPGSRAVIWAHNTHVGDARATDMARRGEVNIGQLLRQSFGPGAVFIVGFGTGSGTVLAAPRWEGPARVMQVPPPRDDSLEAALTHAGDRGRLLLFSTQLPLPEPLFSAIPHRAIGVVFVPEQERATNYVVTRPALRYDAFVFLPRTRALTPLDQPGSG